MFMAKRIASTRGKHTLLGLSGAVALAGAVAVASLSGCGSSASAQTPVFTVTSPDLASGTFDNKFLLNAFGCKGENVSPAVQWTNPPAGTKSFALQIIDTDAPVFWHWAVYNIPGSATGLAQGAGNSAATLPAGAIPGTNDFLDTGATGMNGNYGGPCPPAGDAPHHYTFRLYALGVDKLDEAGMVPKTGTPDLYNFVINIGVGPGLLGKATFTATYGR
ncbi:MAG: hypothetical protein QOI66_2321 [Myxococcales bacterium]|nr:hypothetical protein [Myxococcales bacterium]